jgi:hypothetical protein
VKDLLTPVAVPLLVMTMVVPEDVTTVPPPNVAVKVVVEPTKFISRIVGGNRLMPPGTVPAET